MMKDLVIDVPTTGIAGSPNVGYGDIRNLDIFSVPGTVKLNYALAKVSSTTIADVPYWIIRNPLSSGEIFALSASGVVYRSSDTGASWASLASQPSTAGGGQGMAIWKNYLFVARSASLDVYGPLSSSPSWTNSWKSIDSDADWHPMYTSYNDGKLYGGAGRYVFSIDETTGSTFAPGTSSTYTFTAQALDLPANYKIKALCEQGNDLMIGAWMGSNIYDFKVADIFPWDRSSPSFKQPIQLNENGVHAMLNVNGIVYVVAGVSGKVFSTNGYQASLIAQVPESIAQLDGGAYTVAYPQSLMHHKGRVWFGLSGSAGGNGVWSMQPTSKGTVLTLENSISTGNYTASSRNLLVPSLLSISREVYLAGWRDTSTYGIDSLSTARSSSYTGYFESPLYQVGTNLQKRTFTQIEFLLAKPLAAGQGVKIEYRTNTSDAYTTIGTFTYASLGAVVSHNTESTIPSCEEIQIKVSLERGSSTGTTPELRKIILR